MRRIFSICVLAVILFSSDIMAQKLVVRDNEGIGIPLASVLTEDGILIGTTDLDGVLPDVNGAKRVRITHIAYKPQMVTVASLKDGIVVMEDYYRDVKVAIVRPKPYIYMEYYFRAFSYINDSLRAYAAGILPIAHDIKNKYEGKAHGHFWAFGGAANKALTWNTQDLQDRAQRTVSGALSPIEKSLHDGTKFKNYYKTTVETDEENRWLVRNPEGIVGNIVHSDGYSYTTLNGSKMQIYANKMNNESKMAKIREERDYDYQYMQIYKIDADGTIPRENFVMESNHWEYNAKAGRKTIIVYLYAVDNAYMDKDEYTARAKGISKPYSGNMSLEALAEYEKKHNIPALPPEQMNTIMQLKKQTGRKN